MNADFHFPRILDWTSVAFYQGTGGISLDLERFACLLRKIRNIHNRNRTEPITAPAREPGGSPFDRAGVELGTFVALDVAVGRAETSLLHDVAKTNSDQSAAIFVHPVDGL